MKRFNLAGAPVLASMRGLCVTRVAHYDGQTVLFFSTGKMMDKVTRGGLLTLGILVALAGCQPAEEIIVQRIPKNESGYQSLRNPAAAMLDRQPEPTPLRQLAPQELTDRMLVAIYPLQSEIWFFKLNGPLDQVAAAEPELLSFFENVEFREEKPNWELPENWKAGGARPMRFATLLIGDSAEPLELAISSLQLPQDLTLNVNRWRGQMLLAPIEESDLKKELKPLKSSVEGGLLFDVGGKFGGGMMPSAAPFAGGRSTGGAETGRASLSSGSARATSTVEATTPEGWAPGATSGMVPIRLQKSAGERTAQITVIPLPAAANEWEPNIKRWAGEVDLLDWPADRLRAATEPLEVDGQLGNLIRLIPDDATKEKATIAGMVVQQDTAWFVKLSGDKQIVSESESTFTEFLKSLKFPAK